MSQGILKETSFFLHTIGSGIFMMFLYDILRIIRRLMKHDNYWVAIEDIIYWCICGILMFLLIFKENNGIIRGFAVGGIAGGMILYHETVSGYFVKGTTFILSKILFILGRIFKILFKPFRVINKRFLKLFQNFKNPLKKNIKRVKIWLRGHWKNKKNGR